MANVAALKKKAIDFESKKQFDKAIAAYREVIDAYDRGDDDDIDVTLYNRVGDLLSRQGNNPEAVTLYERAVDLYTEGGFFNNAIALCNKVLRASPGRASIYYKLGKISAAKGFKGEAKQNFLEYADRMQKNGQMDEAFRALKEFADLVPDQDDVRLMLADQLTKAGKTTEALTQLEGLYHRHESAGRTAEMDATLKRMKAIDPAFEPSANELPQESRSDDLIFIDLDAPPRRATRTTSQRQVVPPPRPAAPPPKVPEPPGARAPEPPSAPAEPEAPRASMAVPDAVVQADPAPEPPPIEILSTAFEGAAEAGAGDDAPAGDAPQRPSLLGLEPTSFADPVEDESAPMDAKEFDTIDLDAIEEAKTGPTPGRSDLALGGELPSLSDEPRISGSLLALDADQDDPAPPVDDVAGGAAVAVEVEPTALESAAESEVDAALDFISVDADASATDIPEPTGGTQAEPEHFGEVAEEVVDEPPPAVRRASSMLAANAVLTLRVKVADAPEDWALHRQLAEALLDAGEREEGMKELESALAGFDKANDIDRASSVADEIVRIDPSAVRYHQKRVEYAFRANDKPRTADAYLALADALLRNGQTERARTVYQRVLELAPTHAGAQAALESLVPAEEPPPAPAPAARASTQASGKRYTGAMTPPPAEPRRTTAVRPAAPSRDAQPVSGDGGDDFVSLGDWLRADEAPKSTRMVVEEQEPTGDEQADFADMLRKFKQGISENVEDEDHEAHYDLGVAYKEMGLVDEAIAEFQKALRGAEYRARTYEALGQCFLEKMQLPIATTILQRALNEPGIGDEQLVGVLYLLGYIFESQGKPTEAKAYYERVFGVDIEFRDVGERLSAVDRALR